MNGLDRQRLFAALTLLVMALFVAAGLPHAARWRRLLQRAALIGFVVALAAALFEIGLWWVGLGP